MPAIVTLRVRVLNDVIVDASSPTVDGALAR
jgi:hypothetical protein